MMEELLNSAQVLDVRILNKIDTYEQWMLSGNKLAKGEIAIATIEQEPAEGKSGLTPPAVGIRVGDGEHTFAQLPWLQASAGDVYAWAKAADKPSYNADEISGLESYISQKVQDSNTTYEFFYANDTLTVKAFQIGEKEAGGEGEVVATLPIDVSTKIDKVTGAKAGDVAVFTADGALQDTDVALSDLATVEYVDGKFAVKTEVAASLKEITDAADALAGRVGVNEGAITALQAEDTRLAGVIDTKVTKVAGAQGNVVVFGENGAIADGGSLSVYETVAHAEATYAVASEVAASLKDITDAADDLASRVGTAEGEIDELQEAMDALKGSAEGSVQDIVDAAINKFATDITDNGTVDSFKELVDWVAEHGPEATEMAGAIKTLQEEVIPPLANQAHQHNNFGLLETITEAKVNDWDAAVQSVAGVETTKEGTEVTVTGVSTDLLKQGTKTIVFNCGSATSVF